MKAFDFVKLFDHLPTSTEKPNQLVSNSELRRWFEKKSIRINGTTPKFDDEILFPITELTFHPKGQRKCTFF